MNIKYINLTLLLITLGIPSTMIFTSCGGDDDNNTATSPSGRIVDGHEYVDLGLSVKWATCNVGAKNPWETGDYFAWGETVPKETYTQENYKFKNILINNKDIDIREYSWKNSPKYVQNPWYGYSELCYTLNSEDDAATVKWGSNWRIPSLSEIIELYTNCYFQWTHDYNGCGFGGYVVFKAKDVRDKGVFQAEVRNNNSEFPEQCRTPVGTYDINIDPHIFIPQIPYKNDNSMCYFWTSTADVEGIRDSYTGSAIIFAARSGGSDYEDEFPYFGAPIRPVCQ